MKSHLLVAGLFTTLSLSVFAQSLDFVSPKDGDIVPTTFIVKMAVTGMKVAPAGEIIEGTGHHHLLINTADIAEGQVIPNDTLHKHFGKGQTETEVSLQPGKYKLTLQFADGVHRSYGEKLRKSIEITVK
jgi:hypothetical protein